MQQECVIVRTYSSSVFSPWWKYYQCPWIDDVGHTLPRFKSTLSSSYEQSQLMSLIIIGLPTIPYRGHTLYFNILASSNVSEWTVIYPIHCRRYIAPLNVRKQNSMQFLRYDAVLIGRFINCHTILYPFIWIFSTLARTYNIADTWLIFPKPFARENH